MGGLKAEVDPAEVGLIPPGCGGSTDTSPGTWTTAACPAGWPR